MNDDGSIHGFWVALGFAFMVGVVAYAVGYDSGHEQGVKDHAAGRYVVVPMPDGTEVVCEVKEAAK